MKKYLLIVCALVLAGCSVKEHTEEALPTGWKLFETKGTFTYIYPVNMDDGTKCVVVSTARGAGVSCNWK